jgi:phosphatidylinositol alpha-1,6-mannosyltransferase
LALQQGPFDVVFCGHVYMAPIAWGVARLIGARFWLQTHGADIWKTRPALLRRTIEAADMVTTVSRGTRDSLLGWVDLPPHRVRVLPDTVQDKFVPGPVSEALRDRLKLGPGPILLTVGRLSAGERYKGHEQVFGVLPRCAGNFRPWSMSWPAAAMIAPTWSSALASWPQKGPCASSASCRRRTCSASITWPTCT